MLYFITFVRVSATLTITAAKPQPARRRSSGGPKKAVENTPHMLPTAVDLGGVHYVGNICNSTGFHGVRWRVPRNIPWSSLDFHEVTWKIPNFTEYFTKNSTATSMECFVESRFHRGTWKKNWWKFLLHFSKEFSRKSQWNMTACLRVSAQRLTTRRKSHGENAIVRLFFETVWLAEVFRGFKSFPCSHLFFPGFKGFRFCTSTKDWRLRYQHSGLWVKVACDELLEFVRNCKVPST